MLDVRVIVVNKVGIIIVFKVYNLMKEVNNNNRVWWVLWFGKFMEFWEYMKGKYIWGIDI